MLNISYLQMNNSNTIIYIHFFVIFVDIFVVWKRKKLNYYLPG
jgi:hypothetical protein